MYTQDQIKEARAYATKNNLTGDSAQTLKQGLEALGYKKPFGSAASIAAGASSGPGAPAESGASAATSDTSRDALLLQLHRTDPSRACFIAKLLGSPLQLPGKALEGMDAITKNLLNTVFTADTASARTTSAASQQIAGAANKISGAVAAGAGQIQQKLQELLSPISRATGEVLANAQKIVESPLGAPFVVGQSIGHLLDKISPGITNRIDAVTKKLSLDALGHLPTQVVGSVKQLMSAVSSVACLPLSIIGDLNALLTQLADTITALFDQITSIAFNFLFGPGGIIDSLIPLGPIMSFLNSVSEIASVVGAVAGLAGGSASFMGAISQVQGFAGQAMSAISNPGALAMSYLPAGVSQGLSTLRNPGEFLNKLMPPKLSKALGSLQQLCSISQTGNLGFALAKVLGPAKAGALSYLTSKFQGQAAILGPLLGKASAATSLLQQNATPKNEEHIAGGPPVDSVNKLPTPAQSARPNPPLEEKSMSGSQTGPANLSSQLPIVNAGAMLA